MTSKRSAGADPRRARTVSALLESAERLFRDRTLDEVTVEEIASGAGVAIGSLYNHFGSKAGVYAALVHRAIDVDRGHMDRAYTSARSAVDQLYAAAEEYLAFYLDHPDYFRLLAFPTATGSFAAAHEVAAELAGAVTEQNSRMVAALRAGMENDTVRPHPDPEEIATVLWASWNGIISLGWRSDPLRRTPEELRTLLRTATDVIAHGILAAPAAESA